MHQHWVQFFQERFESFSDPDIPPFHYGSHYSSAGIVLFYLIRMEPFAGLNRSLQARSLCCRCWHSCCSHGLMPSHS